MIYLVKLNNISDIGYNTISRNNYELQHFNHYIVVKCKNLKELDNLDNLINFDRKKSSLIIYDIKNELESDKKQCNDALNNLIDILKKIKFNRIYISSYNENKNLNLFINAGFKSANLKFDNLNTFNKLLNFENVDLEKINTYSYTYSKISIVFEFNYGNRKLTNYMYDNAYVKFNEHHIKYISYSFSDSNQIEFENFNHFINNMKYKLLNIIITVHDKIIDLSNIKWISFFDSKLITINILNPETVNTLISNTKFLRGKYIYKIINDSRNIPQHLLFKYIN